MVASLPPALGGTEKVGQDVGLEGLDRRRRWSRQGHLHG